MTSAADIVDGLTGSEVRQFALAALQAVAHAAWHQDARRFIRDMQEAADLAERLAYEPAGYEPIPVQEAQIRHVHIVRALTDEQREEARQVYIPRARGGKADGVGPTIKQLALQQGVSYGAMWRALRRAA